jgi:hypothetical protein
MANIQEAKPIFPLSAGAVKAARDIVSSDPDTMYDQEFDTMRMTNRGLWSACDRMAQSYDFDGYQAELFRHGLGFMHIVVRKQYQLFRNSPPPEVMGHLFRMDDPEYDRLLGYNTTQLAEHYHKRVTPWLRQERALARGLTKLTQYMPDSIWVQAGAYEMYLPFKAATEPKALPSSEFREI